MISDRQGNSLRGATAEAAAQYDAAVEAFNIYRGDPVALADRAIELAPEFAMAHLMKAYAFGLATEPEAAAAARAILEHVRTLPLCERAASHAAALDRVLAGAWAEAALALDHHNMRHPHDILALQAGHLVDFYRADARNLRNRIARVLPKWSPERPGYSIVLGFYAFGLEESGDYVRAEAMGREALARQPLDCWAHHAVAHVMEMQGRAEDGIGWMQTRERHWSGDDNFFGGSHAQRDVIDWTLTEAAIRGGMTATAEALANERLAAKPHSPINRGFLRRSRPEALAA